MKKVKFLADFQGVETSNRFFKKGDIQEFADDDAERLIADNRALFVEPQQAAEVPPFENVESPVMHYGAQATPELRNDENVYKRNTEPDRPDVMTTRKGNDVNPDAESVFVGAAEVPPFANKEDAQMHYGPEGTPNLGEREADAAEKDADPEELITPANTFKVEEDADAEPEPAPQPKKRKGRR